MSQQRKMVHMVSAIRQTPTGRYATVMLPQAWILFLLLIFLLFVMFPFCLFSFFCFGPFCDTSVINPIIGRNAPAPIPKARAQETGPVHRAVILWSYF
jgi:hypothetical protein